MSAHNLLLLAGTTEGRMLAAKLCDLGIQVFAATATETGAKLLSRSAPPATVLAGRLSASEMKDLIFKYKITFVLDCTHPYAELVSLNAMEAAVSTGTPYLRYDRPAVLPVEHPLITWTSSFEEAAQKAVNFGSTVFLTVGSKELGVFVREARSSRVAVTARLLDDEASINAAKSAGLSDDEILYFRGTLDRAWERGDIESVRPSVLVCKDSGVEGGTLKKLRLCEELDIPMVAVSRPVIEYPSVCKTTLGAAGTVAGHFGLLQGALV